MIAELDFPELKDLSTEEFRQKADDVVDDIERAIAQRGGILNCEQFPVVHRFAEGMYIREIHMPAGAVLTSKIHKTEHPFVVLKGVVSVWSANEGAVMYRAPFMGITKPFTRRVLLVHEDTVWVTFHPADETEVDEIEDRIIQKRNNPRLKHLIKGGNDLCLGEW
jgi:hypothetical protein